MYRRNSPLKILFPENCKCTKWPSNDLEWYKIKGTLICSTSTGIPNFTPFSFTHWPQCYFFFSFKCLKFQFQNADFECRLSQGKILKVWPKRIISLEEAAVKKIVFSENHKCPQMTLNITRSKLSHVCATGSLESQIFSLRFALWLAISKTLAFLFSFSHWPQC